MFIRVKVVQELSLLLANFLTADKHNHQTSYLKTEGSKQSGIQSGFKYLKHDDKSVKYVSSGFDCYFYSRLRFTTFVQSK